MIASAVDLVGQVAQAGAEDDGGRRVARPWRRMAATAASDRSVGTGRGSTRRPELDWTVRPTGSGALLPAIDGFLAGQHAQDELRQLRLGGVGGGDDLGHVGRLQGVGQAHVGDDREADDLAGRSARRRSLRARWTCRRRRPRSSAGSDIRPAFPGSGPATATNTPRWATMFSRRATSRARSISLWSYGSHMSGKRGPRRSSLMPISGLAPIRLMWSSISMMSPQR